MCGVCCKTVIEDNPSEAYKRMHDGDVLVDGLIAWFYGVDGNCFKLGDTVFEAIEDESDGYRSMLKDVVVKTDTTGLVFAQTPFVEVTVREVSITNGLDGYELVDGNGHVWLALGTVDWDDYYPTFTFRYEPSGAYVSELPPSKEPIVLKPIQKPFPAFAEPKKIVIDMASGAVIPEQPTGRKFKQDI